MKPVNAAPCALVRRYVGEVADAIKEAEYRHRRQANKDVDQGVKILRLFLNPAVSHGAPFAEVRAHALALLPSERLTRLCEHLSRDGVLDELTSGDSLGMGQT